MSSPAAQLQSTRPWLPTRREFLKSAAVAAGATMIGAQAHDALAAVRTGLIDVNVNLGDWPVRRLPQADTPGLVAKLRAKGVTQAWAGSFDGLLHKDLAAVNLRLIEDCNRHGRGLLLPFGSINPRLPGWEDLLAVCADNHRMRGIRLHPNYHGYSLDDPNLRRLLARAAERKLIVQIALVMEDERMMHPLVRVEPVDPKPLTGLATQIPGLKIVLLNALRTVRGANLKQLVEAGQIYFEISMLEGVGGIQNLIKTVPIGRILFGTHSPLFYFEAAELKLRESGLTSEQASAILHGNAAHLGDL